MRSRGPSALERMLCQNCKLEPATVHVIHPAQHFSVCPESGTEIYKFKPTERHLCQGCAQSQALTKPSLPSNIATHAKIESRLTLGDGEMSATTARHPQAPALRCRWLHHWP